MKRREFFASSCGAFMAVPFQNLAHGQSLKPDTRGLIDTPEKRTVYINQMLKELVTDLGPHPVGTESCLKAENIIEREMRRSLPIVERDTITFDQWYIKRDPVFMIGDRSVEICPSHGTSGTETRVRGVLKKSAKRGVVYDLADPVSGKIYALVTQSPKPHPTPRPYWFYDTEPGGWRMFVWEQGISRL
jgi:hypothetical protein